VNVIAPIFTNEKGLYLQTIFYPLQLFANNVKGNSLTVLSEGPTYKSARFPVVPYIDSSAALDGNALVVNIVNRHQTDALDVTIALEDKRFAGAASVAEVNGPDIKAMNDFGSSPVGTKTRSQAANGNSLTLRVAAHSYTQVRVTLA